MSVDNHDTQTPEDAGTEEALEPQAEPLSELEQLQQQLAEAQAKAEENWDQLLRANAEMENIRKRAEREALQARKYALEGIARELLPVYDSLTMGQDELEKPEASLETAREGMRLITQMMGKLMDQFSIKEINPEGEVFDPEVHQAMSMLESADKPANTVLQVLQKGYRLNDRMLRPAMVIVAKAPETDADADASDNS